MGYEQRPCSPGYWSYDGLPIQADVETHRFAVAYARKAVPPGGMILDVGAGSGAFAKQLLDAGLQVACTSWDDRISLPIESYRIDLDHAFGPAQVGGRQYHLVTCLEVIEHVENPSALLRSCRDLVRDDGHVLLSTPNIESAQARLQWLFKGYPAIFHGNEIRRNRHISMMWREGLEFLIERAGFAISDKQLLGRPHIRIPALRAVKFAAYRLMRAVLRGELYGETRLYVLRPIERPSGYIGPGQVY